MINNGIKENVAVPWGLYFHTPWIRKNYLSRISKKSWGSYAYAVRNSFRKLNTTLQVSDASTLYLPSNFSLYLTDRCIWNLRKRFMAHRACRIYENEIDFTISTYHASYDFYDFRKRAVLFWTADNTYFRDPTFYITSYDPTILLSPRKHLLLKFRLAMIAKFHRTWRIFANWQFHSFTISANNIIGNFATYIRMFFNNAFHNYFSYTPVINLKAIHFLKYFIYSSNSFYSFLNITCALKRFFKIYYIYIINQKLSVFNLFFKKASKNITSLTKISLRKLFSNNLRVRNISFYLKNNENLCVQIFPRFFNIDTVSVSIYCLKTTL